MPRQSAALKLLRGNPGQGPIVPDAIPAAPLDPEHPIEIDQNPVARAEWYRIVPALIEARQVTTVDRSLLIAYCVTWAQWRDLTRLAEQEPMVVVLANGNPAANPTRALQRDALAQLVKLSLELGLSPIARSRVSPTAAKRDAPPAPVGKWGAMLK